MKRKSKNIKNKETFKYIDTENDSSSSSSSSSSDLSSSLSSYDVDNIKSRKSSIKSDKSSKKTSRKSEIKVKKPKTEKYSSSTSSSSSSSSLSLETSSSYDSDMTINSRLFFGFLGLEELLQEYNNYKQEVKDLSCDSIIILVEKYNILQKNITDELNKISIKLNKKIMMPKYKELNLKKLHKIKVTEKDCKYLKTALLKKIDQIIKDLQKIIKFARK
jgi:hypothetical protein